MLGKGIGTKLLAELSRREKGKLVYLYTDDHCTYQFYESKGFERSEEKIIQMDFGVKTVPLTCLYYSKQKKIEKYGQRRCLRSCFRAQKCDYRHTGVRGARFRAYSAVYLY